MESGVDGRGLVHDHLHNINLCCLEIFNFIIWFPPSNNIASLSLPGCPVALGEAARMLATYPAPLVLVLASQSSHMSKIKQKINKNITK